MVKVIISGALGRMGRKIAQLSFQDPDVEIVGGVENPKFAKEGQTIGQAIGEDINAPIVSDLSQIISNGDVVIDFASDPEAVLEHTKIAADHGKAMVIGTTGLSQEQINRLKEYSKRIPIVFAPNMSIGVNLLFKLVREAVKVLKDKGYDIEVVEMHHRFKKDAPSGTAVKIVDILKEETGIQNVVYGREGVYPEGRPDKEIGVFALRGGDVVGEHTVIFAGLGERIELTHKAGSRDIFAKGAVEGAKWVKGKPAGLYDMQDVLGLK
ncbi:MAG: 4-hydroxy-tetrahydrodipicolinate reductase [Aquificae bacterium]|nr:4-hydroxy-tetrahydrodipicolinate reductase [Aquificota bacterium]